MSISHLFVIDPIESLNLQLDSSLRIMLELAKLGHQVFCCTPIQLSWSSTQASADAHCAQIKFKNGPSNFSLQHQVVRPLKAFSAIHMRKDPPYDMDYIATTWLLDSVGATVKVYNAPQALRQYNEKLAILKFPRDCHQALVSSDPESLLRFVHDQANGDAIVKPLTLFGGRGVDRIQLKNGEDIARAQLVETTSNGHSLRLVQPFDQAVFIGEVRAFSAFGEPIAWCLKRPAAGNYLANTRAGATLEHYTPNHTEVERVTRIARTLLKDGVAFIGFDLIGGYVSEINLTSPRLLQGPDDHHNYYEQIAALVAADLSRRS
jgi:glutathione synthase